MNNPGLALAIGADRVARLTLQRSERHNALDRELIDALDGALASLPDDCRALVLQGEGASFCAGADMNWMQRSVALSDDENRADATALSALLDRLDRLPCPTIARVQGAAIGGGAGLVACCDIAIASDAARFAFSEVRLGLTPATISPYVLRAIGARAARKWFLDAERFDAEQALRLGLVHEVAPAAELDQQVDRCVASLLKGGPCAQSAAKRLIEDVASRPIDQPLRSMTVDRLATVRAGAEAQEGLAAFLDKRSAAWR